MDPNEHSNEEIKILLKKNLAISEENNRMLRGLRNSARFHSLLRFLILISIIIGIILGYRYFKPYFDQARDTYNSYNETQSRFMETMDKFIPK